MRAVDIVLDLIGSADPKRQSEIIRKAWKEDITDFWVGLEIATNPHFIMNLKSVPFIDEDDDGDVGSFSFADFYDLSLKIAHNELTGKLLDQAIYDAAGVCNITEWNQWYRRILLKNLHQILPMSVIQATLLELTSE